MKTRKLVLATLTPLVALGGTLAVADEMEMEAKEMRVWSAVLSEPSEEAAGVTLRDHREPGGRRQQPDGHRGRGTRQHLARGRTTTAT